MAIQPDVIVIGGGVIGCAVAHEISRRGARVVVLEGRAVSLGATQASAGILAPYIEGRHHRELERLILRSLRLFDGFMGTLAEASGIQVQYERTGTLEVASDRESAACLAASVVPLTAAGARCYYLDRDAVRNAEPRLAGDVIAGLLIEDHGFVNAGQLTHAMAASVAARGRIETGVSVHRVASEGAVIRVESSAGSYSAPHVVVAAGSWTPQLDVGAVPALPVRPVRGQLLHLAWPDAPLARVTWSPRCYLVPWSDGTLLVGATAEEVGFDERATVAGVRDLLESVCELVPDAWRAAFRSVKVGLRPATPDELPIIGASHRTDGLVYAAGHFRSGVVLAPLTATLVADLVLEGTSDPDLALMTPARFGDY